MGDSDISKLGDDALGDLELDNDNPSTAAVPVVKREIGGRDGPEPTRYGDWEKAGRCIDF